MKFCFSFLFLILFSIISNAQGVKGFIVNAKGEALPYVSIYAQPIKKGANSNVDGSFLLNLPAGEYLIQVSSIDYKPASIKVTIAKDWVELKVVLEEQSYQLAEVKVRTQGIDPAVYIMRKAISAAPYYRRQILRYTAKVYIKGTGSIDHVPKLMRGMVEESTQMEVGKTYVTESVNDVLFMQPSTYKEKVLSMQSTMPLKDGPEPMRMVRGSVYNTDYTGIISPLSPQAFSVYNFILEGSFYENGREINKIRIEPKRKGSDVYSGYVYVIEKLWCLHSCILNTASNGVNSSVKITFQQLVNQPLVWVPITYDLSFKGHFLGIKGAFRYLGSVSNYKVTLNPNVNHEWLKETKPAATLVQPKTKNQVKIETLMAKEELNKREMLNLASRMKRESEKLASQAKLVYDSTELVIDSLALYKDSAYWQENRPVPLMETEINSYVLNDSLQKLPKDTLTKKVNKKENFQLFAFLLQGDSAQFSKTYLAFGSPLKGLTVNAINGIFVRTYLSLGFNTVAKPWRLVQTFHLPLFRPLVQTKTDFFYTFHPKKFGQLHLSAGAMLQDFNPHGISIYEDMFQLLALGQNYSRWYLSEFAEGVFKHELINGLNLKLRLGYYHRYGLENQQYFRQREGEFGFEANQLPANETMPTHDSYQMGLGFSYRPFQAYRFKQNKKEYLKSKWPLMQINYAVGTGARLQFQKLDFQILQQVSPLHWVEVFYKLQAGYFINNQGLMQPDRQYFAGNLSALTNGNNKERFQDLPYYLHAANDRYLAFHGNFSFKRLLLKRLPYLNLTSFREALYVNALQSDARPLFYEVGYRVSELFGFLSVGLNQTFEAQRPNRLSLRINFNF